MRARSRVLPWLLLATMSGCSRGCGDSAGSTATAAQPLSPDEFDKALDARVQAFGATWGESYRFHGIVRVVRGGAVVYDHAYGHADRSAKSPIAGDTRFPLGSLTKPFAATVILQLEGEGRFDRSEPVANYVARVAVDPRITIDHLLNHRSGLPDYGAPEVGTEAAGVDGVLARFAQAGPAFDPGTGYLYTSAGYLLLGRMAEDVTGDPWSQLVQQRVFEPLKMTRSTAGRPTGGRAAVGYVLGADEVLEPAGPIADALLPATGDLWSTADDLLAWERFMAHDDILGGRVRPFAGAPANAPAAVYAYGWMIRREGPRTIWYHDGELPGYSAFMARSPGDDVTVIVLANNAVVSASTVGWIAMSLALGYEVPVHEEAALHAVPAASGARAQGSYALAPDSRALVERLGRQPRLGSLERIRIDHRDGDLWLTPAGQAPIRILVDDAGNLLARSIGLAVVVRRSGGPRAPGLELQQGTTTLAYHRVAEADSETTGAATVGR